MSEQYDCLIVGAGPAGLFAAFELVSQNPGLKVAIFERGKLIQERQKNELLCGVGGAGAFSDGKLHFFPNLSYEKFFHLYTPAQCQSFLDEVEKIFLGFGVTSPVSPANWEQAESLAEECRRQGVHLLIRKVRHVGSDALPQVVLNFQNFLLGRGVDILAETAVQDILIENDQCAGVILEDGRAIRANRVLLAPGRFGAAWLQEICRKYKLKHVFEKVEIGVRIEIPASVMKRFTDIAYEAVFMVYTPTFDDVVRSFCHCPNGYVSTENYQGFISVNGHANSDNKAVNSNFALVAEVNLTEPVENTTAYALAIAQMASTIGGQKPILQRLADFKKARRSTWKRLERGFVVPSLTEVTPGDISMALPHRIVVDLKEAIETLNSVLPGLNSGSTLLYAPEVKLRSSKVETDKRLETRLKNLFVAGDGAGLSGTITGAAMTGLVAARGMLD
jgi:uncharacterized FAD-dependent dehydrogenase